MTLSGLPLPVPDADTQPFWDGTARGELLVQQCEACRALLWQPRPVCSACGTIAPSWVPLSGRGRVATWTVPRPPVLPALAELVPFVVAVVELDEGVRMVGLLVDDKGDPLCTDGSDIDLRIGTPVRVAFRDQDGYRQPGWALVRTDL